MPARKLVRSKPSSFLTDPVPLGDSVEDLMRDISRHFNYTLVRYTGSHATNYAYNAVALTLRDRLMEKWRMTHRAYYESACRRTYYLSMEFLMGRALGNAMLNLGVDDEMQEVLYRLGLDLEELSEHEADAGLGNGGLGRLAACFLDSCATLQLPVMGYGIRYEYGMFRQGIQDGYQVEEPDHWLRNRCVWEIERPELTLRIHFGGYVEFRPHDGRMVAHWRGTQDLLAIPYELPIPGYQNATVNTLRLWKAAATDEFDLGEFNAGDYVDSVASKNQAENISMVLYPNDTSENGKELRLRQQYFLASASLQDVLRRWIERNGRDFSRFAEANCFQLNDTHPSIAVAELMRLLVDHQGLEWEAAWQITQRVMAYTNHTLLPEALERWPVRLFERLLPRLLDIIYEINARFLTEVADRWPGDNDRLARMSIIEEGECRQVRMAYLAIVGSFSVNGVAHLHSELLKNGLFSDFHALWPERFNNKTNGITPRRWLANCNPALRALITRHIGGDWVRHLEQLQKLGALADDPDFQAEWQKMRTENKARMLEWLRVETACDLLGPEALMDVQVKRIHEYKRQLLNILHVIHLYLRIKHGELEQWTPRNVIFGGKAAPGYFMAKRIIKLISNVAAAINHDPATAGLLRVAFVPNYRVSAMEIICPGTDLSEQISTAGKEASGTGNMKFMMNGAITIGTLDGANIEIRQEAGEENFFLFGLDAAEVEDVRKRYDPDALIEGCPDLKRVMSLLESGHFNRLEPGIFDPVIQSIRSPDDPWVTAADFGSYRDAQERAARAYQDQKRWTRMSIINMASSGRFSSDRTIAEYNDQIWKMEAIPPSGSAVTS